MIEISSSGGNLKARLPMREIIKDSWSDIGKKLVDTAQKSMETPKHGRTYMIGGKKHTSSGRGEAPASITGALKNSIRYKTKGIDMLFGAGDNQTDYAKFLELGTAKMDNRPFIFKSVEDNFKNIEVIMNYNFMIGSK